MKYACRTVNNSMRECVSCQEVYSFKGYTLYTVGEHINGALFVCDTCYNSQYKYKYPLKEQQEIASVKSEAIEQQEIASVKSEAIEQQEIASIKSEAISRWNQWAVTLRKYAVAGAVLMTILLCLYKPPRLRDPESVAKQMQGKAQDIRIRTQALKSRDDLVLIRIQDIEQRITEGKKEHK